MSSQHLQPAPSSNHCPLPGQPRGHMFPLTNVAGNRQADRDWEDMRPSVENPAARDQLQNLQHHDHLNPDYAQVAQVAQDVPIQAHLAPPAPPIGTFNDDVQQAAAGPAPVFLDEVPHQFPVPNERAFEALRQLALLYLHDPNSQVAGMYMEPGQVDEVMVVIALRLTNL